MHFTDLVSPTLDETAPAAKWMTHAVATLRYNITDDFRLRLNYGETLRRPAFADLTRTYAAGSDERGLWQALVATRSRSDQGKEHRFAEGIRVIVHLRHLFQARHEGARGTRADAQHPGTGLNVDVFVTGLNASTARSTA